MFTYLGERIGKADNHQELIELGISRVSVAVAIKEKSMFRGCYFSYNKKVNISDFIPTQLRAI